MPSLLIVDDLTSIHEMLAAVLQPTGLTAGFATDGGEALARYRDRKYDLVLTDIDMLPMDGLTFLRRLKQFDPAAVVIVMTAFPTEENLGRARQDGAFACLQKPFQVDELIATLRRGLKYRRLRDAAPRPGIRD